MKPGRIFQSPEVRNLRDFGGWRTTSDRKLASGRLLRSGHWADSKQHAHGLLRQLNPDVFVDLRRPAERKYQPSVLPDDVAIEVPTESTSELQALSQDKHLTINVMASPPFWALDGKEYQDFKQFEQAFISSFKEKPDAKVIIAADKEAQVQPLMTLLALMQRQQISNTQILMEP